MAPVIARLEIVLGADARQRHGCVNPGKHRLSRLPVTASMASPLVEEIDSSHRRRTSAPSNCIGMRHTTSKSPITCPRQQKFFISDRSRGGGFPIDLAGPRVRVRFPPAESHVLA